jgi:hypothetical protein
MKNFKRCIYLTAVMVALCMSVVQAAEYETSINADAYSQADTPVSFADVEVLVSSTVAGEMPAQFESEVPSATEARLDRETFESVPEKTLVAPGIVCPRANKRWLCNASSDYESLLQETDTVDFT